MPNETQRKIPVVFYRTPAGAEVVRDWLKGLEQTIARRLGKI
jgi:hypothetical protein